MVIGELLRLLKGETIVVEMTIKISLAGDKKESVVARCEYCGWEQSYSDDVTAKRGLNGHLTHCSSYAEQTAWIDELSKSNGRESQDH